MVFPSPCIYTFTYTGGLDGVELQLVRQGGPLPQAAAPRRGGVAPHAHAPRAAAAAAGERRLIEAWLGCMCEGKGLYGSVCVVPAWRRGHWAGSFEAKRATSSWFWHALAFCFLSWFVLAAVAAMRASCLLLEPLSSPTALWESFDRPRPTCWESRHRPSAFTGPMKRFDYRFPEQGPARQENPE